MHHKQQVIEIERLALQGDGVGRIAAEGNEKGKVAFVPYSLPTEIIRAEKILEKKTYSRWLPGEIVGSSPDRIEPSCPYHFQPDRVKLDPTGLWCGGCNWQHFPIEKQREAKRRLVSETLERLGGCSELPEINLMHSENSWRYRNNVQIAFGSRRDTIISGFRAPDSHEIVDIDDCLLQTSASVCIFKSIRQTARTLGFIPYERHKDRGWLKHLLIRSSETGSALVILATGNASFPEQKKFLQLITSQCPEVVSIYQNLQPAMTGIITGPKWLHLWGRSKLEENLCGLRLNFSPGSFFQVNTRAASLLYQKAIKEAEIEPGMTVLDLYCGVGGLTLMAAQFAEKVIGVDEFSAAIEDAQDNAHENGVTNATFFNSPVEDFLTQGNAFEYSSADRLITIVDPPRAGCRPEVIDRLLALTPRRIIYVSCDPATLARDLKLLSVKYQISTLTVVDLFPQTAHIETIARLDIKEA